MNEVLFFLSIILNFTFVTLAYKLFDKTGVYAWIALATIIANIEVVKCVDIFGMPLTLGNITYGSIFLATDILSEKYGIKSARNGVFIGFFSLLVLTLLTQIDILFIPNNEDFAQEAMKTLFTLTPRICFGSMIAYLISNTLDVFLYEKIKKLSPNGKFIWLRNNTATMTSQLVDTIIFTFISFYGIFTITTVWELCITTYLIKIIIALCDTPFLYIANYINNNKNSKHNL